ncbi:MULTISPECIES: SMP-30/gluconolactonase/LRE family protein [unclassified Sphingobacterium]|uniref:SMP-30/gluconolactonase/LRE family protein n=1 Tax=unclassified Sphingobacterium TaxID=2609468 RepID=UPI0025CB9EED|nr:MULTISPECIES: SMP-30/gluconolactonase/LRE family protein [unclassified Sphingobacterium]
MNILLDGLQFPEGPAFDHKGNIWLVEKEAGNLVYYKNNRHSRIAVGGHPNGIAIDKKGNIWFCDSQQNSIRYYDPIHKKCTTITTEIKGKPLKMPNDLCFDRLGNLLFTCPGDDLADGTGYLCCLNTHGLLAKIQTDLFYPNGLAFAADHCSLFVAETGTKWIWRMRWNPISCQVEHSEKFLETGGSIGPDGIALSHDNHLFAAIYGSQHILSMDINSKTTKEIFTPGMNPTNCALDRQGIQGLIVTEAQNGQLLQWDCTKKGLL